MNVTQLPVAEAASALEAWLKPLRLERDATSAGCEGWKVYAKPESTAVTLTIYPHLEAISVGFTVPMRNCSRLQRLELVAALNDDLAFARFTVTQEGTVAGEYMMACNDHFLPSNLDDMVRRMLDMQGAVQGVLEAWHLALPPGTEAGNSSLRLN